MSSNTEKAMELAKEAAANYGDRFYEGDTFAKLRAHIEAMQRDCRTCAEFDGCRKVEPWHIRCKNHDQWQAVEFKQLTRS